MVIRINGTPQIEDLRNHPKEIIEKLSALLVNGAKAKVDGHRKFFYEVENCTQVFYVHVSPLNGKVSLLATWTKDSAPAALDMSTHRPCAGMAA